MGLISCHWEKRKNHLVIWIWVIIDIELSKVVLFVKVWETLAQVQYPPNFRNFLETYHHNLKARGVARYLQNVTAVSLQWDCIKIPKPNCLQAYQGIYMVWGFDVLTTQPICDMNSLPRHFHDVIYLDAKFQLAIVPFLRLVLATSLLSSLKKQQFIKNNILCKESAKKTHYEKRHFSKRLDMGIIYLFLYRYTCSYTLSKLSFCFCMKWNSFFHQDMAQINSFGILLPTLGHNHWDVLNEV